MNQCLEIIKKGLGKEVEGNRKTKNKETRKKKAKARRTEEGPKLRLKKGHGKLKRRLIKDGAKMRIWKRPQDRTQKRVRPRRGTMTTSTKVRVE